MIIFHLILMIIEILLIKFVFALTWPVSIVLGLVLGFLTVYLLKETDIGDMLD